MRNVFWQMQIMWNLGEIKILFRASMRQSFISDSVNIDLVRLIIRKGRTRTMDFRGGLSRIWFQTHTVVLYFGNKHTRKPPKIMGFLRKILQQIDVYRAFCINKEDTHKHLHYTQFFNPT